MLRKVRSLLPASIYYCLLVVVVLATTTNDDYTAIASTHFWCSPAAALFTPHTTGKHTYQPLHLCLRPAITAKCHHHISGPPSATMSARIISSSSSPWGDLLIEELLAGVFFGLFEDDQSAWKASCGTDEETASVGSASGTLAGIAPLGMVSPSSIRRRFPNKPVAETPLLVWHVDKTIVGDEKKAI